MAKTDENGHLTDSKELALAELLTGASDEQAAQAAGVTRQTVNTWRNHDAVFAAELNRRRADLWAGHKDRIRAMIGLALDVVTDDLQSDDVVARSKTAWEVLKLTGKDMMLAPGGPQVPEMVELEWQEERTVGELDRMLAEM